MSEYDKKKPVLLLATGPSARKVNRGRLFYTCSINLSGIIIDLVDFWVINDANFIKEMGVRELSKISNMCIPEFPHSVLPKTYYPSANFRYDKVLDNIKNFNIKVFPFNIQTVDLFNIKHDINLPKFDVASSGESALHMMRFFGFNKIILVGFDPAGGRSPYIPGKNVGSESELTFDAGDAIRYNEAFNRIITLAKRKHMKVVRLEVNDNVIINDNIVDQIDWNSIDNFKNIIIK